MKAKIYISPKKGILDPQGRAVMGALNNLGFKGVTDVRVGKFIEIELEDTADGEAEVRSMCEELLHNPLVESYTFEIAQ